MKKCTYCGKEYSDEATACAVDAQSLDFIKPRASTLPSNQPTTPPPIPLALAPAAKQLSSEKKLPLYRSVKQPNRVVSFNENLKYGLVGLVIFLVFAPLFVPCCKEIRELINARAHLDSGGWIVVKEGTHQKIRDAGVGDLRWENTKNIALSLALLLMVGGFSVVGFAMFVFSSVGLTASLIGERRLKNRPPPKSKDTNAA